MRMLQRLLKTARAKVIVAALEHGELELDRERLDEHWEVFQDELLLQIDGVGGDDRLFVAGHGVKNGGDQIGKTLANASAGLDDQVLLPPSARATATAIFCCCGRYSKLRDLEKAAAGENISSTSSTSPVGAPAGWASARLIMASRYRLRARRGTTSCSALFLTIMRSGRIPRQTTFG